MGKIYEKIREETTIDENGNRTTSEIKETRQIIRQEPDYIKIYTKMWCEFNEIPERRRELFLQLALNMSYACQSDSEGGQLVNVTGPIKDKIAKALNCKESNLYKGLKELQACNAIRKVSRGWYQVNPSYASKGEWRYNPKKDQGGIENIIANFNFKDKKVATKFIWGADTRDISNILNEQGIQGIEYMNGLNIEKDTEIVTFTDTQINNPDDFASDFDDMILNDDETDNSKNENEDYPDAV